MRTCDFSYGNIGVRETQATLENGRSVALIRLESEHLFRQREREREQSVRVETAARHRHQEQ